MLGECNALILGLLSASKHDPSKFAKEGNIANINDKYAIGNNGNDEPLAEGDNNNNAPIVNNDNDEPLANNVDDKYA